LGLGQFHALLYGASQRFAHVGKGFRVFVDGKVAHRSPVAGKVVIEME
jgi:hypothetical protein